MALTVSKAEIIKNIDSEINYYSQRLEYEKAAILRDRKNAIMYLSEKQKVSNINDNSIDVIGIYKNSLYVCLEIFFIRNHYFVCFDKNQQYFLLVLTLFITHPVTVFSKIQFHISLYKTHLFSLHPSLLLWYYTMYLHHYNNRQ